jgi:hypothetical protein
VLATWGRLHLCEKASDSQYQHIKELQLSGSAQWKEKSLDAHQSTTKLLIAHEGLLGHACDLMPL